jgi:pimeloyl-ACP methyl ester carboxylesterase
MLVMSDTYLPTIARLARSFRVLAPDMPGSGRSSPLPAPWSFERYARWAAQFLDALRVDEAIVVGHSNSGAVAIMLAALHPERVAKLVLVDTVGAREAHSLRGVLLARARDGTREMRLNARAWHHVAHNALFHRRTFTAQVRAAVEADLLERARGIAVPTLIAWGRQDRAMPVACAERLQASIPHARLYLTDGTHDWPMTRPEIFARAVGRFAHGLDTPPD